MTQMLSSTPRQDGFFMPGEWALHKRTWMLWPERSDNWRQEAKPAQKSFAAVAAAICQFEPVTLGVNPGQLEKAQRLLPKQASVMEIRNNDAWMRDCGPTFLVNNRGDVRLVNWIFNAWGGLDGGLYSPWDLDDRVPVVVAAKENLAYYRAPLVLEGGSIHVDGEGTLLTTEECLLNKNRNPGLSKKEIEEHLREYIGVEKCLWLGAGVYHDETSGHVDNLACFLQPGVVALTWTDDHNDPQYPISQDAFARLRNSTDARGRNLEVIRIHQPDPIIITEEEAVGVEAVDGTLPRHAGDRMAASYINFYLCNGGAIVPVFGDPRDQAALDMLGQALVGRRVVGEPAREILLGGGNIHCITQQQPAGIEEKK